LPAGQVAASAAGSAAGASSPGTPWKLPSSAPAHRALPVLGAGDYDSQPQLGAALTQARTSGKTVTVTGLTTGTSEVTVSPAGVVTVQSYVLPVRVKAGAGWVPVSTTLRLSGGRLSPVAIPGDAVSFSPGGAGPMAVITSGVSRLALSWPGTLPAPVVSGSSATYANVLPGVDLVLTATSTAAGGFSEVLVVHSASAAQRLAGLRFGVSGLTLRAAPGGGLVAPFAGGSGAFVAPPAQMWDSSAAAPGSAAMRAGGVSASGVGSRLAPPRCRRLPGRPAVRGWRPSGRR
jgi:hypothetical protein